MAGSKSRPQWGALPRAVRDQVEDLLGGRVVAAQNCPGGFSPGFASRLRLASGGGAFVKAMDATQWPGQADLHRAEARAAAVLPASVPAPAFLGSVDGGGWVVLGFEEVTGAEPTQPWELGELRRVAAAAAQLTVAPFPVPLPRDHPRLGGWAELARDTGRRARLAGFSPWAAARLPDLVALERDGLAAARGPFLVHFDLYAHNILLTPERVAFVDWPHARLGAPFVDLVLTLSSAAGDGIDVEPVMREHQRRLNLDPGQVTAVLAAHAGFCVNGSLAQFPAGLEPIAATKQRFGRAALTWLEQRLSYG